jgi:hypothetical protein
MKNTVLKIVLIIELSIMFSYGAKLELSENVQKILDKTINYNSTESTDFSDTAVIGKEEIKGRPVVYEVIKAKKDEKVLQHYCRNVPLPKNVLFNAAKGAYCYNNIDLQKVPLRTGSIQVQSSLKKNAHVIMEQLLGKDQAARFVFANEETDYVKFNDNNEEIILEKTFRFTRKLNGRHILDNTSYVKLSFAADNNLSAFEIVNPEIIPLRNVKRLIKSDVSKIRLTEFAARKETAIRNGPERSEHIGVKVIKTEKVFDTYLSKVSGGKKLILPTISFYSDFHLENGENFQNWTPFCLDADYVPDINKDFITDFSR